MFNVHGKEYHSLNYIKRISVLIKYHRMTLLVILSTLGCDVNRMMQFCDSLVVVCHGKHNDSQNAKDLFDILLQNIFFIFLSIVRYDTFGKWCSRYFDAVQASELQGSTKTTDDKA